MFLCFYFAATTGHYYLAKVLSLIAEKLHFSQNLAGLTLIALGNMACDVIFNKEKYPEATLAKLKTDCNYNLEIASGTLMVREFEGKNGTQQVLVIYVSDCTINDEKKTNHKKSKDSLI